MPAAEVDVDEVLVERLLRAQAPADLVGGRRLAPLAFGWDNVVLRLGDDLVVRLPRRAVAAELIETEQRWLPILAPRLPLPVPAPVFAGEPGEGYPWRWSVCRWLAGDVAGRTPPADRHAAATTLGAFVAALHEPAPAEAPANPYRGGPLPDRDTVTRERIVQLGSMLDGPRCLAVWDDLRATPSWTGPPRWLHGDLHPANLLVDRGALSAVIDFGDLTAGDPATDLSVAWSLFHDDPSARETFRDAAGYAGDDDTWRRGRGWALSLALAYLANSADHPLIAAIGRRMLDAALRPPA